MKVPTYKQETARTRETGSRNFSAQVSGRDLAAPFEAQAEAFGQLANQSLDFMSAQLKRERDSQQTKESLAILEEREKVKQIIRQTPVGELFLTDNITGPGGPITFNSEADAENFYQRSMDEFRKQRGFKFATEKREQAFNTALERDDIFEKSDIVSKARVRVVQNAVALHEQELAALTNQLRTTAFEIPDIEAVSFDSVGFNNEMNIFSLRNPRIEALFTRIEESIDQAVSNELYTESQGEKLKNNIRSNTSEAIIKEKIEFSNNPQFLEEISRQIQNLSPTEISADDRVALSNLNQKQISQILSAKDAEERARILEENRVSKELAEQIEFQIRTKPESINELRRKLIKGEFQGLGLDKRNALLSLIETRQNRVSDEQKAEIAGLMSTVKAIQNNTKRGMQVDLRTLEETADRLAVLGERESAENLRLAGAIIEETQDLFGRSAQEISDRINKVQESPPSIIANLPGERRKDAQAFLVERLQGMQARAVKAISAGQAIDYAASADNKVFNFFDLDTANPLSDSFDSELVQAQTNQIIEKVFTSDIANNADAAEQIRRSQLPFPSSTVNEIKSYLQSTEKVASEKLQILTNLQPLFESFPRLLSEIGEDGNVYGLVASTMLREDSTKDLKTAEDVLIGLGKSQDIYNQIKATNPNVVEAVTQTIGNAYGFAEKSDQIIKPIQDAVLAVIAAKDKYESSEITVDEVELIVERVTGGYGEIGGQKFDLPRDIQLYEPRGEGIALVETEITLDNKREFFNDLISNMDTDLLDIIAPDGFAEANIEAFVAGRPQERMRPEEVKNRKQRIADKLKSGDLLLISVHNDTYAFREKESGQVKIGDNLKRVFTFQITPELTKAVAQRKVKPGGRTLFPRGASVKIGAN